MLLKSFDLETNSGDTKKAEIIQCGIVTLDTDTGEKTKYCRLIKPYAPIPAHIEKLTGISNEMVAQAPRFEELAQEIAEQFAGRYILTGFNIKKFDIPILHRLFNLTMVSCPINMATPVMDVSEWYRQENRRTLTAAIQQYVDPTFADDAQTHQADDDAEHTLDVLLGMVSTHADNDLSVIEEKIEEFGGKKLDMYGHFILHEDKVCIGIGKHSKPTPKTLRSLLATDGQYLNWASSNIEHFKSNMTKARNHPKF